MSGFETAVLWDVTPCALVNWPQVIGGTFLLHVQGVWKRQPICIFPADQFAQGHGFAFIIVFGYVYSSCQ